MTGRPTVAVDFDGVIHSYTSPWEAPQVIPDPPVEGAIDWLNEIAETYDVAIFTTRGQTALGRMAVRTWLAEHGCTCSYDVTSEKVPALLYIDDRAWRFEGPGSFPDASEIRNAIPWNKKPVTVPIRFTLPELKILHVLLANEDCLAFNEHDAISRRLAGLGVSYEGDGPVGGTPEPGGLPPHA